MKGEKIIENSFEQDIFFRLNHIGMFKGPNDGRRGSFFTGSEKNRCENQSFFGPDTHVVRNQE